MTPGLSGHVGREGPGRLPEGRERFPLARGFQRGRWGRGWVGGVCVRGFRVWAGCGAAVPETQRQRGQRNG